MLLVMYGLFSSVLRDFLCQYSSKYLAALKVTNSSILREKVNNMQYITLLFQLIFFEWASVVVQWFLRYILIHDIW